MSHGSEEGEDYWPGYVDALTSMVQVLAFVMMLLAMAVFVLSQNVTKAAIKTIAEAADVDGSSDVSVTELTAKVVQQLKERRAAKVAAKSAATQTPPPETTTPASETAAAASDATQKDTGAGETAATAQKAAETNQATISVQVGRASPAPAKLLKEDAGKTAKGDGLQVRFTDREAKMTDAEIKQIESFVKAQGTADAVKLTIRAYAFADTGALSDARRLSYYRVLNVRANLTRSGVDPKHIRIKIVDTLDAGKSNVIEVSTTDGDN